VMEESGISLGNSDVLSITVNRYVCPREGGRGPARLMCMWAKQQ
jgi:hypothetical protein